MQQTRVLRMCLVAGLLAASGAGMAGEVRRLSMDDCVQLALQHNLDVQISRVNPRLAQYALSGSYAAYDPALDLSATKSSSSSPTGVDAQGRAYPQTEQESDAFSVGLSGLFTTGLQYSFGTQFNDTYGQRPGADWSNPVYSVVTLTNLVDGSLFRYATVSPGGGMAPFENSTAWAGVRLSQPLLKNAWIDGARLNIAINKKNLKTSELTLQYQLMRTVTDVVVGYYNLIAARDAIKVQEKALQSAEQLLRENKKRVEVGVLAPLDEKDAESQVAASRAALLAAQNRAVMALNTLKNLLTDKYTDWADTEVEPTERLSGAVQVFSRQDSWNKGLSNRPDFLQAKLEVEKLNLRLKYDKNQLLPQLDVRGTYGQSGSADEFSGAFGQVRRGSSPAYSVGAALSLPLSNRAARYNYRASKANVEQALLRLKQVEQSIMVEVDNAIATAQSSLQGIEATRQARLFAEAALDAEQKKLDNGKSTSYQVLQYQRILTERRSAEISALIEYNNALARLSLSEGATFERYGIKVESR